MQRFAQLSSFRNEQPQLCAPPVGSSCCSGLCRTRPRPKKYCIGWRIHLAHLCSGTVLFYNWMSENDFSITKEWDDVAHKITLKDKVPSGPNPSYFTVNRDQTLLYAVNEVGTFQNVSSSGGLSAFHLQASTGQLTRIDAVPSLGGSPAFIILDNGERFILAANYDTGNYGVWAIESK